MTDRSKKITELAAASSAIANDVMVVVTNTATTAVTKKITVGALLANISTNVAISQTLSVANVSVSGTISVNGAAVIASNGHWVGSGSGLKGDTGGVGAKGDKGSSGDKGQKGDYGLDGTKGQKGEPSAVPGPYADDAAAAVGGIQVGGMYYQTSGAVYIRLA
jgi:hypothetical protein